MAMTALERKRRSLEKKKELQKLAGDPSDRIAARRFYEHLPEDPNWQEVLTSLEWAGIDPDALPAFDSDEDPGHEPETDGPYRGSIGRAERMVGCLLDAATELASIINGYKRQQINGRLDEIAMRQPADESEKKRILTEVRELTAMERQLETKVRWSLPQWKVKGT